ncbi:MAG: PIG-L deacetylase family protein [Candidatus Cloacimonadaceae bacterium]
MKKVLVISVHPDDETLGCGGTILKHKAEKDYVSWLNISNINTGNPMGHSNELIEGKNQIIKLVREKYNFDDFINLPFQSIMLDTIGSNKLIHAIDQVIMKIKPDIIYLPNRSDVHSDHRIAFNAIYPCTKNFRKPFIKQILMYETLSETEFAPPLPENAFIPNYFIDISDFFDSKVEIMQLYTTELMPDPLPRSIYAIKSLAAYRGSRIGVKYAEAFINIFTRA